MPIITLPANKITRHILIFIKIPLRNIFPILLISFTLYTTIYSQQLSSDKLQSYNELARTIVRKALIEKKGYNWLKELCNIGPRLSGSEKSLKAIHWAEKK